MKVPVLPELPRVTEDARAAIGEFLATGALYETLTVPGLRLDGDTLSGILPPELRRPCVSETCRGFESQWALTTVVDTATAGSVAIGYRCRNCSAGFEVACRWHHEYPAKAQAEIEGLAKLDEILRRAGGTPVGHQQRPQGEFHFQKVGQWPEPTIALSPDLAKALGKHGKFYRRAMISRNQGYGIGALAYFRRIVEDTSNDQLDLLADALREDGADPALIRRVEAAKAERVFEEKAKVAAAALPDALRPGGFNPFQSLHDVYSRGVHGLSDEQCVEMVDEMREDIEIIFKMLKTHVDDKRQYKSAAQRLQAKRPRPPKQQ